MRTIIRISHPKGVNTITNDEGVYTMLTPETLLENKKDIPTFAQTLTAEDIRWLVDTLTEKNDEIRYAAFLTLQERSIHTPDVYSYWETLASKLADENSYQRSIGIMLLAENARWDKDDRFSGMIDLYLLSTDDEKFITARQCLQSLVKVIPHKPALAGRIADRLLTLDILKRKDTQRKLLLMDILGALAEVQKIEPSDRIMDFLNKALTGGLLDKKAIKEMEKLF